MIQIKDSYGNIVIDIHIYEDKEIQSECTVIGFMICDHAEHVVNKRKKEKKMGQRTLRKTGMYT